MKNTSSRAPDRGATDPRRSDPPPAVRSQALDLDFVDIPGGSFVMGSDAEHRWPDDHEGPARTVTIDGYRIGRHAVSNAEFAEFSYATGYVTDAEHFGWSFVWPPKACNKACLLGSPKEVRSAQ